jgi:hypothetical protein
VVPLQLSRVAPSQTAPPATGAKLKPLAAHCSRPLAAVQRWAPGVQRQVAVPPAAVHEKPAPQVWVTDSVLVAEHATIC